MSDFVLSKRCIEKAGVALATYHLCRNGLDPVSTSADSKQGDLWVKNPSGQIVQIEIKASSNANFFINLAQVQAVDFVIFASIRDSRCWITSSADLTSVLASHDKLNAKGRVVVHPSKLLKDSLHNWSIIFHRPAASKLPSRPNRSKSVRIVRKRLADGTIKEYRYGPDKSDLTTDVSLQIRHENFNDIKRVA